MDANQTKAARPQTLNSLLASIMRRRERLAKIQEKPGDFSVVIALEQDILQSLEMQYLRRTQQLMACMGIGH